MERQANHKGRSNSQLAFHPDMPFVRGRHPLHDRQTEAQATLSRTPAPRLFWKRLEQRLQGLSRNPRPFVLNGDFYEPRALPQLQFDLAAGARDPYRIA